MAVDEKKWQQATSGSGQGRACIRIVYLLILILFSCAAEAMARQPEPDLSRTSVILTPAERAWLAKRETVRVRVTNWPPYMITEPTASGISIDYINAVARRYGFKVEFVTGSLSWSDAMDDVKGTRRHFDLLPTMSRTAEREVEFALTDDYLSAPWVIYTRNDSPYVAGPESLKGKTVSAEKGYAITAKLKSSYPEIHILELPRSQDALEAVATGRADAYVGNLAISNFLIKKNRLNNLVVAAPTPFGLHKQAMAIRSDWPELASLINKGLASMTAAEIHDINQKWGAVEVRPKTDYKLISQISIVALLLLVAFIYWNRRLAREIIKRQRIEADLRQSEVAQQQLNQTLEEQVYHRTVELESVNAFNETILKNSPFPMGVYEATGQCVLANEAYARLIGTTSGNLLEQNFNEIGSWQQSGLRNACLQALSENLSGQLEIHTTSSFGKEFWVDCRILPTLLNGERHLLLQFVDMCERKKAEQDLKDSEYFIRTTMDSVPLHMCVLSASGEILAVNKAWRDFYDQNSIGESDYNYGIGSNYLDICRAATGPYADGVEQMADGICNIRDGKCESFSLEYECNSSTEARIFLAYVTGIEGSSGNLLVTHENITQRRQMEDELRQSEERLQTMFKTHSAVMLLIDPESGAIIDANQAAEQFYGRPALELQRMNIADINAQSSDEIHREMEHARFHEKNYFNFSHRLTDGSVRDVEVYSTPINAQGKMLLFSIIRDITERKSMEVMARRKTEELDSFFKLSLDLLCIADIEGNFKRLNHEWETVLGYPLAELEGRKFLDIVHPDDRDSTIAAMSVLVDGKPVLDYINRYRCRDGSYRWIEWRAYPYDANLIYAAARDITRRKQMEDELRESRQQLENIIDFLPDAAFVIDNDMRVIAWNRAMEEMSGVPKGEILGQGDHVYTIPFYGEQRKQLLDLLDCDDDELELCYQNVSRRGNTLYAEIFAPALNNGGGAHIWVSGAPLFNSEGQRVGAIELLRDISERKRIEQEIRDAKEAAEAANRAKSEFLANMSHEIRTPMNAITGMAYLALQTELDARQREYVTRIRTAADSLLGIINDILDFSKIEANKMELESVNFDLDDLFSSIHNLLAGKAEEKNLKLSFSKDPEIPSLLIGDQLRLRQILNNLASNAVKFTETGSVQLSVTRTAGDCNTAGMQLKFSISDTGIGMDSEHLQHIFAPFTQADSSISRRYGGTGLGLAIVSRLLELMGSRLEIASIPGQGSTFSFSVELGVPVESARIPLYPPENFRQMGTLVVDERNPLQLSDVRILVVEDDKVNQIIAQQVLTQFGAKVVTMENGASGVDAALGNDFDVVFMDIQMPGMNGYEAANAIRQVKGELELPIIAMTAHAFNEDRERCLAAGMNDHIAKPIDPDQLYSVMLKWLPADKVNKSLMIQKNVAAVESSRRFPERLPGIDVAALLHRCGGNEILAGEIIIRFRDQQRNLFNTLRGAMENGNSEQAKGLLHTLKGLAGTVGATSLAASASEMEIALKGDNGGMEVILPAIMEQQLAEVFEAADILAGIFGGTADDSDWCQLPNEKLEPLLKELHDSLSNNSLGAKRLFEGIKQYLRLADRNDIQKYITRLDFEMAVTALERAAQSLGISLQRNV